MLRIMPVACFMLLSGHIADAQAQYKCTTKDGKVTYSDKPCPEDAGQGASQERMTPPVPRSAASDAAKPAARPGMGADKPTGVPGMDFALFKKAIDAGDGDTAHTVKSLAKAEDVPAMQGYAESQCRNGKKAACSAAYCGDRYLHIKDYYSRRCADTTGRAYGDNWMEEKAGPPRRDSAGNETFAIACRLGGPASSEYSSIPMSVECATPRQCRHNQAVPKEGGSVRIFSAHFSSLKEAAEAGCKLYDEAVRKARGR